MVEKYESPKLRIRLHDVSPYTWDACAEWIDLCASLGLPQLDLFVVPRHGGGPSDKGAGLPPDFLSRLRELHASGYPLWIHGWTHDGPRGEAEFSGMDPVRVVDRARRAMLDWKDAGLPEPHGFCPPCWKMPSASLPALFKLGYRHVDLRFGVARPGAMEWSPALSTWGGTDLFSRIWDRTLPIQKRILAPLHPRVALHPQDLSGPARRSMEKVLATLL
jgi:predicted deacetylase